MMTKKKFIRLLLISGSIVVLDQVTKVIISSMIPLYRSVSVIPGFFNLTHIQNPGGMFGFLSDQNSMLLLIVFIFFSIVAIGLIVYFYIKIPATHPFLALAFTLILGGAIGNLIDRIRQGMVIDFLDFYIGNLHWPVFNIADSAITIGVAIFIFHVLFDKIPKTMN